MTKLDLSQFSRSHASELALNLVAGGMKAGVVQAADAHRAAEQYAALLAYARQLEADNKRMREALAAVLAVCESSEDFKVRHGSGVAQARAALAAKGEQ